VCRPLLQCEMICEVDFVKAVSIDNCVVVVVVVMVDDQEEVCDDGRALIMDKIEDEMRAKERKKII